MTSDYLLILEIFAITVLKLIFFYYSAFVSTVSHTVPLWPALVF